MGVRGRSECLEGSGETAMPMMVEEKSVGFEREALPHLDSVYRLALSLAGEAADADDLVQETMLKAYRAWYKYQSGTNVRAWLLTILRNTFISHHRHRQLQKHTVEFGAIEGVTVFAEIQDVDPESRFFDQLVEEEVIHAIHALPAEFREVLVLSDIEGLHYAEVAEITQVPVGTVKSRLHRARHAVQRQLYEYAVEMGYVKGKAG